MKFLLINLLLIFSLQDLFGQLIGNVKDAEGTAIPYANVILLNSSDTSLVKGTLTNEKGDYLIEKVLPGSYILRISSVSYQTLNFPVVEISAAQLKKDFGTQVLESATKQLTEVIIRVKSHCTSRNQVAWW